MPPNMRVGGAYPDVFFTLADPYRLILCAQEQRQLGRSQRGGLAAAAQPSGLGAARRVREIRRKTQLAQALHIAGVAL
jgi:hypothetical protein